MHTISGFDLTLTSEKVLNVLPVLTDEYDAKYVFISYEDEYCLDSESIESLESITENSFDAIVDNASIGTMFYVAYNI